MASPTTIMPKPPGATAASTPSNPLPKAPAPSVKQPTVQATATIQPPAAPPSTTQSNSTVQQNAAPQQNWMQSLQPVLQGMAPALMPLVPWNEILSAPGGQAIAGGVLGLMRGENLFAPFMGQKAAEFGRKIADQTAKSAVVRRPQS